MHHVLLIELPSARLEGTAGLGSLATLVLRDAPQGVTYPRPALDPHCFRFRVHPEALAVVRLEPGADLPGWLGGGFTSVTRTPAELSIVCPEARVPAGLPVERGRVALGIVGTIPMSTIGILAALCRALAEAEVPVFVLSTYDTDWLLVPRAKLAATRAALVASGHAVEDASTA